MTVWYMLYFLVHFLRFWYHAPRQIWQPCIAARVRHQRLKKPTRIRFFLRKKKFLQKSLVCRMPKSALRQAGVAFESWPA
jgi:hypothetical protein